MMKQKITLIIFGLIFLPSIQAIDINTATEQELIAELHGIGKIKAKRLVEYRKKIGGFTRIEQIMEVKGIGLKTFQRNRDKLELSRLPSSNTSPTSSLSLPISLPASTIPACPIPTFSMPTSFQNTPSFPTAASLNLSPLLKKSPRPQPLSWRWSALILLPFFLATVTIFISALIKGKLKKS